MDIDLVGLMKTTGLGAGATGVAIFMATLLIPLPGLSPVIQFSIFLNISRLTDW